MYFIIRAHFRCGRGSQQRQLQAVSIHADAVFAVIEDTDTAGWLGQVGIAVIADLEHGLFARVVTGDGALDAAELCFTAGETRTHICMEAVFSSRCFSFHTRLLPIPTSGVSARKTASCVSVECSHTAYTARECAAPSGR